MIAQKDSWFMKKGKSLYGIFILALLITAIGLYGLQLKKSKRLLSDLKKEIRTLKTDRTELRTLLEDANLSLLYSLQTQAQRSPTRFANRYRPMAWY